MPIEMKLKCKISDDEIIVYTSRMLQVFALIFGVFYVLIFGTILWMNYYLNGEILLEKLWFPLLVLLIFPILFLVGKKRIIFNKRDETVYKSFGFGRKEVARFSEIAKIQYVGGNNCYKIFLKSDSYGKGIAVTSPITGKESEKFNMETLPVLEQMIFANNIEAQPEVSVNIENLKYYTRNNTVFKVKKDFTTIWSSFVVLLGVAIFIWMYISNQSEYLFLPFFPILAGIYGGSRRSFFDVSNRTFNTSVFFFIKKNYRLEQFVNFRTVRNTINGMYNDTSVELIFQDENGKQTSVKLRDFYRTKKIESFIAETKAVMGILK